MATAASAANSPTTAAARSESRSSGRSQTTISTPTGSVSRITGCHSAETASSDAASRDDTAGCPSRSATKYGSAERNASTVTEASSSSETRIGAASAPATAEATSDPAPSGSISTASIPPHTSSTPVHMASRAAWASAEPGSRRAISTTVCRSSACDRAASTVSARWRRRARSSRSTVTSVVKQAPIASTDTAISRPWRSSDVDGPANSAASITAMQPAAANTDRR